MDRPGRSIFHDLILHEYTHFKNIKMERLLQIRFDMKKYDSKHAPW